jgi:hypothetical protein
MGNTRTQPVTKFIDCDDIKITTLDHRFQSISTVNVKSPPVLQLRVLDESNIILITSRHHTKQHQLHICNTYSMEVTPINVWLRYKTVEAIEVLNSNMIIVLLQDEQLLVVDVRKHDFIINRNNWCETSGGWHILPINETQFITCNSNLVQLWDIHARSIIKKIHVSGFGLDTHGNHKWLACVHVSGPLVALYNTSQVIILNVETSKYHTLCGHGFNDLKVNPPYILIDNVNEVILYDFENYFTSTRMPTEGKKGEWDLVGSTMFFQTITGVRSILGNVVESYSHFRFEKIGNEYVRLEGNYEDKHDILLCIKDKKSRLIPKCFQLYEMKNKKYYTNWRSSPFVNGLHDRKHYIDVQFNYY